MMDSVLKRVSSTVSERLRRGFISFCIENYVFCIETIQNDEYSGRFELGSRGRRDYAMAP